MQASSNENASYGKEISSWFIPEYNKHHRDKRWYILAIIVSVGLLIYCFFTNNFLFAAIIVLAGVVIVTIDGEEPALLKFIISTEGIIYGSKFFDYDEIATFAVVYRPREGVKNLYFEFKNPLRHRLSVPLNNLNPLPIRENLLKYLSEDLERTSEPISETFGKIFKL
jgi:hypothetical protein